MFLTYDQTEKFAVISVMKRKGRVIGIRCEAGTVTRNGFGERVDFDLVQDFLSIKDAHAFIENHGRGYEWKVEYI